MVAESFVPIDQSFLLHTTGRQVAFRISDFNKVIRTLETSKLLASMSKITLQCQWEENF